MKRTFQPKKRHRARVHGFRKRMSTSNGRISTSASKGQKSIICITTATFIVAFFIVWGRAVSLTSNLNR